MRKSSDFPSITSKHPLLMSQLPFEQYRIIFKLIKTRQQCGPFLTQVSHGILTSLISGPPLSNGEKDINHVSPVGEEKDSESTGGGGGVCQSQRSAGVIGPLSSLESFSCFSIRPSLSHIYIFSGHLLWAGCSVST